MKVKTLSIATVLLLTACAGYHRCDYCDLKDAAAKCDASVAKARNERIEAKRLAAQCNGSIVKGCNPSLFFDFNSSELKDKSKENLNWVGRKLSKRRNANVVVTGYADMIGEDGVNMEISKARAEAVKNFLIEHGIHPSKVIVDYKGNRFASSNPDQEFQEFERRVDIKFVKRENAWYDDAYDYLDNEVGYLFE